MGKTYKHKRKAGRKKKGIENFNEKDWLEWMTDDSGFSTYKKIKRRQRRAKAKQELREGNFEHKTKNTDKWDWL